MSIKDESVLHQEDVNLNKFVTDVLVTCNNYMEKERYNDVSKRVVLSLLDGLSESLGELRNCSSYGYIDLQIEDFKSKVNIIRDQLD